MGREREIKGVGITVRSYLDNGDESKGLMGANRTIKI